MGRPLSFREVARLKGEFCSVFLADLDLTLRGAESLLVDAFDHAGTYEDEFCEAMRLRHVSRSAKSVVEAVRFSCLELAARQTKALQQPRFKGKRMQRRPRGTGETGQTLKEGSRRNNC